MDTTGNTILITGGGSGIGRGLAEAFHKLGNTVVVAGRRQHALDAVTAANPGMRAVALDVADPAAVRTVAGRLLADFPALNVLVNNAGIARMEALADGFDPAAAEAMVATNVLGPVRLTAALLPHLRRQPRSAVLNVSSGLAIVPLTAGPTYSATKAFLHSWTLSLRHQLRDTPTEVVEVIPPYVQTELGGPQQATDPKAMPLADFVAEVMALLRTRPAAAEVVVERCKPLRFAADTGTFDAAFAGLNDPAHQPA